MNIRTLIINTRSRNWIASAFAALFLALGTPPAQAIYPLPLTFGQSIQTIAPGGSVLFSGVLSNPQPNALSFGGDSLNQIGSWPASLVADDTPFLTDAPPTLAASGSFSGSLFNVTADPTTPLGTYSGTFQVEYDDSLGNPFFATQGFQVIVAPVITPVPEASTIVSIGLLLALGCGSLGVAKWRKKARSKLTRP